MASKNIGILRHGLWLIGTALIVACGGGGGGSNVRPDPPPAAPPPQPPATPPVVSAPNPAYSQHLTLTNTAPAHAAGLSGEGVTIGVVDSGVTRTHPALSPRVIANLVYVDPSENNVSVDDVVEHGTAVAQAMAGTPFGAWPGGVAPGAEIVSARIISDEPPEDDGSGEGNEVDGALGLEPIHRDLIDRGVKIMNNSWGGLYWTNPAATAPIAAEYRPFIINNGGLVVFATGNSGYADPSSMAALPSQPGQGGSRPAADLERGWIAVTALDTNSPTQIASYANRCGEAMRYCLAAPGKVVVTGTADGPSSPTYWSWSGTSLAAPLVSGAAALVWEAFPYFSNDLVRQTLLGTATDLGAQGVDPVFGYGGLNVGNAIKGPARLDWGTATVSFGSGTSTWSNTISGGGGLVKQGGGELVLSAASRYTGLTRVSGGTLEAADLRGSAQIDAAGTLALRGGVGGQLVNNGTLTMRGSPGQRVIGGNYTQTASARLLFLVGAPLAVRGSASLGGELQVAGIANGYVRSSRETVLTADGGVGGRFASLTSGPGVFLEATLGYNAGSAWLDLNRLDVTAAAQSMALTPASLSSAGRVEGSFDVIDSGDLAGQLADGFLGGAAAIQQTATAAAAERTLSSLSGELQAADSLYASIAVDGGRRALEERIDAAPRLRAGAWSDEGAFQRESAGRLAVDGNGWSLGQDFVLREGWVAGASFGQARTLAWFQGRNDRDRTRVVDGQAYSIWQAGESYILGRYAQGRIERDVQRELLLGVDSFRAVSDHDSRYQALELQAGRRLQLGGMRWTPYAGLRSLRLDREAFSEDELVGFGLRANASTLRANQALVGLRAAKDWSVGHSRWSLFARAERLNALSQTGADIDARFNAIDDVWSAIPGEGFGGDATALGFGLEAWWPRAGQWRFGFDARDEGGRRWNQAELSWQAGF